MVVYKLTDKDMRTGSAYDSEIQWVLGEEQRVREPFRNMTLGRVELCSSGALHFFESAEKAIIFSQSYVSTYSEPRLFKACTNDMVTWDDEETRIKGGALSLTLTEEMFVDLDDPFFLLLSFIAEISKGIVGLPNSVELETALHDFYRVIGTLCYRHKATTLGIPSDTFCRIVNQAFYKTYNLVRSEHGVVFSQYYKDAFTIRNDSLIAGLLDKKIDICWSKRNLDKNLRCFLTNLAQYREALLRVKGLQETAITYPPGSYQV